MLFATGLRDSSCVLSRAQAWRWAAATASRRCLPCLAAPACPPFHKCTSSTFLPPREKGQTATHPPGRLCLSAVWDLHEQVVVAACDLGNMDLALSLVQNVHRKFPDGARASRLMVRAAAAAAVGAWACVVVCERAPQAPRWGARQPALRYAAAGLAGAVLLLCAYGHACVWVGVPTCAYVPAPPLQQAALLALSPQGMWAGWLYEAGVAALLPPFEQLSHACPPRAGGKCQHAEHLHSHSHRPFFPTPTPSHLLLPTHPHPYIRHVL